MPTPVGVARQCLTPEAAHALDEGVAVARRRGHAQTTSLHAVSALLSLPSSILRDACARARNSAYSPRLQFKALELCLSVSLDRVPSTQLTDDPPVSNSLMAAIKRSQANQRRQPENFHLYHQISQQPASVSCVKVELQHLILSILDDPVVSRVFGEAGFRSPEIKLAILRPLPQLLRYSRSRGPPIFLCNLTEHPDPGRRSFSFPFSGSSSCDENYRRIGEVLSRSRGRNPLLLGTCAYDALRSFTEAVDKRKDGVLPVELSGLHVICIGKDVSKFITENCNNETMSTRFKEITQMVEHCVGPGLLVNFGDLKPFVSENGSSETVSFIVAQLTKLLELNYGKFWLMGAAASYECYLKFVGKFSSIEKEWDLQLLPITSVRSSMAESYPSQRPRSSLMDSFVPFGGFFSSPSDLKCPLNGSYYCAPHCHQCGDQCEQEVHDVSKERFLASAVDPYHSNLPPWLQSAEHGTAKGLNIKTIDDGVLLDTHESGPHKKWDKMNHHLCHSQLIPDSNTYPTIVGFPCSNQKKEDVDNHSSKTTVASPSQDIDLNSRMPVGAQMISTSQSSSPFPMVSKAKPVKYSSKLTEMLQKVDDLESGDLRSCNMSNSSVCDGSQMSPASVTSVTTDLGLGMCPSSTSNKSKRPTGQHAMEPPKEIPTRFSFDLDCGNIHKHPAQSSSCLSSDYCGQVEPRNLKMLFEALAKKVSWQDEALRVIIKTIASCQANMGKQNRANQRGDIWMNFVGPDRHGKKKIAVSLAEFLYGSQESFIFLDLNSEEMKGYDVKYRGKTTLDFIVGELCKKPLAVVFLENVDRADMLAQNSLSQAIKTGKITDSHGREVGLNNAIFVTSFAVPQNSRMPTRETPEYSEENILRTKGGTIKIKVEYVVESVSCQSPAVFDSSKEGNSNLMFVHKRKLDDNEIHKQHKISDTGKRAHKTSNWLLDLNLPAEAIELQHINEGNSNDVSVTEKQHPWLQDLYDQVDETVVFKPYNFDTLADRVLKVIRRCFHKIVGPEYVLQVESEVMEQLLAAAYVSDKDTEVEDWAEQVLSSGFKEVQRRYNLTVHSIVKLASCQGQALGVYLPSTITID